VAIERMNPEGMHRPTGYHHVVKASGVTIE
jgi:hypothetical protein